MTMIAANLQHVETRIAQACAQSGRARDAVRLLAVSKTFSADAVAQAHACGQTAFGENYIQEAVDKIQALRHLPLEWHCIGPIQSNKTRLVAEHFDWVHTIDRLKIAQRLSEQRPSHLAPLQVCIQVNVDAGDNKSGVMCIPDPAPDFIAACTVFTGARELFDTIRLAGLPLDTLSMGMSGDLEAAIASGSTMVRIGSAIFGERLLR